VNAFDAVNHVIDQIGRAINKDVSALTDMVGGVADVIAGIGDIKAAKDELGKFDLLKALPGIGGAIGGGIQALSSLGKIFGISGGPSAGSKLQEDNTQALRELRRQLAQNLREAGHQAAISSALGRADLRNAVKNPLLPNSDVLRGVKIDEELQKFGISLEDVMQIAEEFGISLKDEKGKFRKSAFEDLNKALAESAEKLRHFSKDIETQLSITDLKQRLATGKPVTPDQELTNQFNTVLGAVGPGVAKFLQGMDTTTEQGRQKLRQSLLNLIKAIESGQIQLADLGQFESADQLLQWIDKLTGSMENLDDQVNASSQNIPNGFKLMLRQFQSDLPERLGPDPIHGPTFDPVKIDPMTTAIVDSQQSASDKIVEAIKALGGKPVPDVSLSQASPVGPTIDTGSASMVDVLNTLVNVNKASEAGIRGVEDAVTALAGVFKEINDTDAAASFRGIQENILRNRTDTLDAGTQTGDAISGDKITNITQTFDININGTDKTAREQWKDVKQIAREESQRRFGTPHRWGEVP
jgi:molecular chaperone GrpE (heat shock protein)